jgi:indoleamine 2,3-dioxygenase
VREWCNPDTYYLRVRPYVTGWPAPGVVYDGVSEDPRKFLGGSAAQSSLLQAFDAMLGLAHPDAPAGKYLRAVRAYMPPAHRDFVEEVEQRSQVRARSLAGTPILRAAYNAALQEMERFRDAHMQLAHDFIIRPSGAGSDPKGTGGTALTSFLRGAQETTTSARL